MTTQYDLLWDVFVRWIVYDVSIAAGFTAALLIVGFGVVAIVRVIIRACR